MARRDAADGDGGALDPALTQKKRARRRLVGALVLGLAAAIVLPLVLDSEPRQTITDVQIEIPPRDTPLPPKADDVARPADDAAVTPPPLPAAPGPAADKAALAPPRVESPKAAVPPAVETPKVAPAPKAKTAPRPPEPAKAGASVPAPKADAPAPGTAPAAGATRFVLQVGAFANPGSARAQADKARKAGVRVYTETVKTAQGERTRVRVGPFASRDAADQARAKLQAIGVASAVVPL